MEEQYRDSGKLRARFRIYELFGTRGREWNPWVFEQLELPTRCRVLELGCDPAALWMKNIDRVPSTWRMTLSDLSEGMVREARQNLRAGARHFSFAVSDAQSVPFHDESFDAVIANDMLYHVPDRQRALAEIRRVLKPHGRLYAATTGTAHLREMEELVQRVRPDATNAQDASHGSPFELETGADELGHWFHPIEVRRNDGELLVTEAEPLVDYIQSTTGMRLDDEEVQAFRHVAREQISDRGAIRITTSAGMFVAFKRGKP